MPAWRSVSSSKSINDILIGWPPSVPESGSSSSPSSSSSSLPFSVTSTFFSSMLPSTSSLDNLLLVSSLSAATAAESLKLPPLLGDPPLVTSLNARSSAGTVSTPRRDLLLWELFMTTARLADVNDPLELDVKFDLGTSDDLAKYLVFGFWF
uniref:Uncharacterized protein n=1 Tax=Opuntia streptacantha TaxID=393608 RepID=A0A7C9E2Q3_OPUST